MIASQPGQEAPAKMPGSSSVVAARKDPGDISAIFLPEAVTGNASCIFEYRPQVKGNIKDEMAKEGAQAVLAENHPAHG